LASIELAGGTSHSVLLASSPAHWLTRAKHDQANRHLYDNEGRIATYTELADVNRERMQGRIDRTVWDQQWDECQRALNRLADAIEAARLDVIVIVGDDQDELFPDGSRPAIAMCGDTVLKTKYLPSEGSDFLELVTKNYSMDAVYDFPGSPELAESIAAHFNEAGFDLMWLEKTPAEVGFGHAFGFILQRLLREKPIPMIPLLLNTYYPPNQPTPARCYDIGKTLRNAIEAHDSNLRVGILASGGLSHFVIDEGLDEDLLEALKTNDEAALRAISPVRLNSGTSEIRNWIAVAGAMEGHSLAWHNYVPIYRSEAGTGCAMCFLMWE
jgi:aromatic ring-opening dioxygenase catalytic subunit (LigB family)